MKKTRQRKEIQEALAQMSHVDKQDASESICARLTSIASVVFADTILGYLNIEDEVDVSDLLSLWIDESRTVCTPVVSWENKTMQAGLLTSMEPSELRETRHGLLEPAHRHCIPAEYIDVVIVPGIAFDVPESLLSQGGESGQLLSNYKKVSEKLIKIVDSEKSCCKRFSRGFRWF